MWQENNWVLMMGIRRVYEGLSYCKTKKMANVIHLNIVKINHPHKRPQFVFI